VTGRARIEQKGRPADAWLAATVCWTWKVRMLAPPEIESASTTPLHDVPCERSSFSLEPANPCGVANLVLAERMHAAGGFVPIIDVEHAGN
jgi:hypothetical protein